MITNQSELTEMPLVVAYGGGLNSLAMLCGFRQLEIGPAMIQMADTGGEHPATLAHLDYISKKCREWWGIEIAIVRKTYQGEFEGLEKNCIRKKMLPSLAYGKKTCSQKYKVQPQTQRLKKWMTANNLKTVRRAIGYDAGEGHRRTDITGEDLKRGRKAVNWYPLIEWQWRRVDCLEVVKRHGLEVPRKSACFFCPAMKRGEILQLKKESPDLYKRALEIERQAVTTSAGRGLGGKKMRWENVESNDNDQANFWDYLDRVDEPPVPCGCYDG